MNRRGFLHMGAMALWPVLGHTPFPQWKVYRQLHLFIVVDREDELACDLGRAIAHTLATELPESRAMVTRARDGFRVASLLSTKQLDVALVPRSQFTAWQQNEPPYDQLEPTVLQAIFSVGDYVLISRDDFLSDHAALVNQTLQSYL
ncbi:hypothetical protein IQ254_02385 [Nodosilinea sp. LEGE 07088]|uniref:hypothetical protein n=1 Tax=Nodosilinea sp. LEGE 07088 TaxID=2777968 RepID=UPI0018808A23|nr:hypothetical protein [Nodosilinea sp. LEGE 07088]MBE9136060.1 hypothetical protein [Nodosilinea sp. LEGE 07088]